MTVFILYGDASLSALIYMHVIPILKCLGVRQGVPIQLTIQRAICPFLISHVLVKYIVVDFLCT